MARADAAPLIVLSEQIAREGSCAQASDIAKLDARAQALVNAHRVPAALAESFMSGVNALQAQAPICLPQATGSAPPPGAPPAAPHDNRGHGDGQGKHGGEGD